jgi:hypothetical protein
MLLRTVIDFAHALPTAPQLGADGLNLGTHRQARTRARTIKLQPYHRTGMITRFQRRTPPMHTPLKTIIQQLQVISDLAEKEADYQKNLILGPGALGVIVGSAASRELVSEPNPCEAALAAFLAALPDDYLNAICALMYAGRDRAPDPVALWGSLGFDRNGAIEAIVEKSPRMQYINDGMTRVKDVNALPAAL